MNDTNVSDCFKNLMTNGSGLENLNVLLLVCISRLSDVRYIMEVENGYKLCVLQKWRCW